MNRLAALLLLAFVSPALAAPAVVRVERTGDRYSLTRDGKPYVIRGVGGQTALKDLKALGGDSIRTWGVEGLGKVLDDAQANGLTVTAGIWLGHKRHGFDYNDAEAVARQYEEVKAAILKYKDHPALLIWGLGNEMEGPEGDDAAVWSAVNNLAHLAKTLDPNHPTMTVVAEIGGRKVANLHRLCPDIDIVGINSYAGAPSVPERYRKAGGTKPYILTEFGPPGQWESPKTPWGAVIEPTSTMKAESYRRAYEANVVGNSALCLGSYAFLWGTKQEATATWFGLRLDNRRTAAVDALGELWTGTALKDRCPEITSLKIEGPDRRKPGETVRARLQARDPEGRPLRVRWMLQAEGTPGSGGDAEAVPSTYPSAIVKGDAEGADVRMPKDGGGYRLFAYVADDAGGAATANVPLFVDGPTAPPAPARKPALPLVVYAEAGDAETYVPSGYMGNTKAVTMTPDCAEEPFAGKTCLRVEYRDAKDWAGVVWQSPPNDWGDRPGGYDLSGAKRLVFRARGASGGETVTFKFGLLGPDKKYRDSASGETEKLTLDRAWKEYAIDLTGKDLSRIKTGFCWVLAADGKPVTFYLDDVRFE